MQANITYQFYENFAIPLLDPVGDYDIARFSEYSSASPDHNKLPEFDFSSLTTLGGASRQQLARIYQCAKQNGTGAVGLLDLIHKYHFDMGRDVYIPTSDSVYLPGKLPLTTAQRPLYFTNALGVPEGYGGPHFDAESAPAPCSRATNIGWLVDTHEFDCTSPEQFDEILAWTRGPLDALLDKEMRCYQDYRGYSVVFSGNRSLHFNFLFSTDHLENAPQNAKATRQISALMHNVHAAYWDHIQEAMTCLLRPSLAPDRALRSLSQWRRIPWGVRVLDEPSEVLGLPCGTRVPQVVVRESIKLRRSPKGSTHYLVAPSFSMANPVGGGGRGRDINDESAAINLLRDITAAEWGEYPEPVSIRLEGGENVIHFRNHADDRKPSTFVRGDYRRLVLLGAHAFGGRDFWLPDHMSANELAGHVSARTSGDYGEDEVQYGEGEEPIAPTAAPENESGRAVTLFEDLRRRHQASFPEALTDASPMEVREMYRRKLRDEIYSMRAWGCDTLVLAPEGPGKTTAHLSIVADEALDDAAAHYDDAAAHCDGVQHFAGFAFRTRKQAYERAEEFRSAGYRVRVVHTFWDYYRDACKAEGETPIARDEFDETGKAFTQIREEQPAVFERLEQIREQLWRGASFNGGLTLLVMTQRAALTWHTSVITRAWHHPEFTPDGDMRALAKRMRLARIILDDPEVDDFVHILPEATYKLFQQRQKQYANWRSKSRAERIDIYWKIAGGDFEAFDAMMRLDLKRLERVEVDFNAIPFGCDNGSEGIYRARQGAAYYLGPREWLSRTRAIVTTLTTEGLLADVVVRAYERAGRAEVLRRDLDLMPPIFPVRVPVRFDPRAAADHQDRERISALATELVGASSSALVIADGVEGVERVLTFQGMKGLNGLEERDIATVMTFLAPEKFAELNVIGRWLGQPDIITAYYRDLLQQAVGRNRGFRQSTKRTTDAMVICSRRLWKAVMSRLRGRVQLYLAA